MCSGVLLSVTGKRATDTSYRIDGPQTLYALLSLVLVMCLIGHTAALDEPHSPCPVLSFLVL